jgi:uncharacterized membrane protein YesL
MRFIIGIGILIIQLISAYILGVVGAMVLGIGNGWELVYFAVAYSLGVWGVGSLATRAFKREFARENLMRLVSTLVGSALGVLLIVITPAAGFIQIVYPLIGALVGYYAGGLITLNASPPSSAL